MKIGIYLIIVLFLVGFVYSETAAETGSFKPENEPASQEPTICGDDICQAIENGVCPEDCQEGYTSSTENSSNNTQEESSKTNGNSAVLIPVIVGSLSLLIVVLGLLKRQINESKDDDSLETWVNKQLDDGYSADEIKNILTSKGYNPETIEEILNNDKYN